MNEFEKRLSPESLVILQRIYSLQSALEMPTFDIQTDQWKRLWHELYNDMHNAIELINAGNNLPEELNVSVLEQRAVKFLSHTRISGLEGLDRDSD